MSKKQNKILQILKIMQENKITIEDIQKASLTVKDFDLLCKIDGSLKRVSFEKGKTLNPVGLFPFATDNTYIVFDGLGHLANGNTKMHYSQRNKLNKVYIPDVDFFEELFKIREKLNEALKALNKPEFRGAYLAVSPNYIPEANWIVGFYDNCQCLSNDFYESKEEAKVCYAKKFKPYKIF